MRYMKATPVFAFSLAMAAMVVVWFAATMAQAQQTSRAGPPPLPSDAPPVLSPPPAAPYSSDEIIDAGHHFFGGISKGIASIVEKAADQWGQPNGYILGEEAGAPSSVASDMAMVLYIPRMPATYGCSGRGQQSASISGPMAPAR
jgi:hypothetical protein